MALQKGDALCASGLSAAIHGAFTASGLETNDALKSLCYALASAIVDEITTNATVLPTLLIAPTGGGPVTGTGTVQ